MPREVEAKISSEFTLVDALMEMEENLKDEKSWMSLTREASILIAPLEVKTYSNTATN